MPASPMRLYLIRHARTAWNSARRAQGHSNIELDEEGLFQAAALGEAFESATLTRVVSSDLKRCRQSAMPIAMAAELDLVATPLLRERSFGSWEGLHYEEVRANIRGLGGMPEEARPPGGESIADVWGRLSVFLEDLRTWEGDSVIVTHGGAKALLLAQLTQGTLLSGRSYSFDNASITELERRPDGYYTLIRYADTSHLKNVLSKTAFGIIG